MNLVFKLKKEKLYSAKEVSALMLAAVEENKMSGAITIIIESIDSRRRK